MSFVKVTNDPVNVTSIHLPPPFFTPTEITIFRHDELFTFSGDVSLAFRTLNIRV